MEKIKLSKNKNTIATVKCGEVLIMFWGWFVASGTECSEHVQGTVKSQIYERLLWKKLAAQCQKALSGRPWVIQKDNDTGIAKS